MTAPIASQGRKALFSGPMGHPTANSYARISLSLIAQTLSSGGATRHRRPQSPTATRATFARGDRRAIYSVGCP